MTAPADLDAVEDDHLLFSLARAVESIGRCAHGLRRRERQTVVCRSPTILSAGKIRTETMRIVTSSSSRVVGPRNLAGLFDWLVSLVAEERGRRVAVEVRSAIPLDDVKKLLTASRGHSPGSPVATMEVRT